MKNETFTPERIKAEADAFFEWDGEDRSLVTTTSCLLFAQHIAGLMQARAAQPAPVVPEGYVLVPKSMWVDAASIEALAFVMGGPEEDDGSPTYCDCVMWVGEIDDDGVKRHGIHVYNTECEEEGSTTLAEFAAAPAQGHQVEWRKTAVMLEQANAGLAQLNGKLRAELSALKAQQAAQKPVEGIHSDPYPLKCPITGLPYFMHLEHPEHGVIPTFGGPYDSYSIPHAEGSPDELWHKRELVSHRYCHDRGHWVDDEFIPLRIIHEDVLSELQDDTAPQPAPAQDVAGWIPVTERLPEVETDVLVRGVRRNEVMHRVAGLFNGEWSSQETEDLLLGEVTHWMPLPAAPAAHDKQSGGEV